MENAKEEFLNVTKNEIVICANIRRGGDVYTLPKGYNDEDLILFLNNLDFEYDNGYGSQELYGMILLKKGWIDRYEYDGSEYWYYHIRPSVKYVMESV